MRRPAPADLLVGATAAGLLAADAYLYRHQQRLITDCLRTKWGTAVLLVLVAHVTDVLGPADPFRAAARLLARR